VEAAAAQLGGVDSTASVLPTNLGAPDGSIRLHIGLEDASTLIGDLTQAME
jgi:cystathionine beta-lyase/cystathionine gamma-synthase